MNNNGYGEPENRELTKQIEIRKAETKNIFDLCEETGEPFDEVINKAVKNVSYYPITTHWGELWDIWKCFWSRKKIT